jgi:hypothetical protein
MTNKLLRAISWYVWMMSLILHLNLRRCALHERGVSCPPFLGWSLALTPCNQCQAHTHCLEMKLWAFFLLECVDSRLKRVCSHLSTTHTQI